MNETFILPDRLQRGDKVAIVSLASGTAALFPWVYRLGIQRLQDIFGLEPVEFPTALKSNQYLHDHPEERANDINTAFADPTIRAVMATLGGNDQIRILPYLDRQVIQNNPKIFTGLSDNTNIHLFLWNLGIISYYGGNLMQQFAMQGSMHNYSKMAVEKALFEKSIGRVLASTHWTDVDLDWSNESLLVQERPMEENPGWVWHNFEGKQVQGRLWGGCLEILDWHLLANKYLPSADALKGTVLYMETSEELSSADTVYRFMTGMALRGMLKNFSAILVGRPKTQYMEIVPPEGRTLFIQNQQQAITRVVVEYAPDLPVVFGLDFGHTDPQMLVPNGGIVEIDGTNRNIRFL